MGSNSGLNLKLIIDILKRETTDWKGVELEGGEHTLSKDDISCELHWRKGKLYEIEAREFLSFAKEDFEENSVRARVNALSNAKRAIECRTDELLTLFNIRDFILSHKSKLPPNLPNKLIWLQKLGIPAPNILKRLISSKRNLLEHDYIIADHEEIRNAVELAGLFLDATDPYIDKGYIKSATVVCTTWYKPGVVAPKWFGKEFAESGYPRFEYEDGQSDEYKLEFDLDNKNKTVKLKHSNEELYLKRDLKTEEVKGRKSHPVKEGDAVTIAILDCDIEEIIQLMTLLREKGK